MPSIVLKTYLEACARRDEQTESPNKRLVLPVFFPLGPLCESRSKEEKLALVNQIGIMILGIVAFFAYTNNLFKKCRATLGNYRQTQEVMKNVSVLTKNTNGLREQLIPFLEKQMTVDRWQWTKYRNYGVSLSVIALSGISFTAMYFKKIITERSLFIATSLLSVGLATGLINLVFSIDYEQITRKKECRLMIQRMQNEFRELSSVSSGLLFHANRIVRIIFNRMKSH